MERLRNKFLNVQVDAVLHPASDSAQQVAKEQKDKARAEAKRRAEEEARQRAEEEERRNGAESEATSALLTPQAPQSATRELRTQLEHVASEQPKTAAARRAELIRQVYAADNTLLFRPPLTCRSPRSVFWNWLG
jgi:dTMP kinase